MLNSRHVLLFFIVGIFDISNLETFFSGFENDETCIAIKKPTSHTAVFVKKKSDFAVVSWNFKNQKWETTIGKLYKEKVYAYSTAKKFEFCFFNTSKTDSGAYDWIDIKGNTQTIVFKVWYGPKDLITTPTVEKFLTLDKYQHFTINCSAKCNPECNITWMKGKDTFIANSTESSSLFLNNVTIKDSGDYACLAENPINKSYRMSKGFRISVQYAARINKSFQNENEIKEYSNTNISCRVDSYPLSNISWLRENKEINTTYSVENEVVMYFENTSCDDTGVYQCSAYNGIGQTDTKESNLHVLCKPRFITNSFGYTIEKRVTKSIGEKIDMNVSVQCNPTPQVVYSDFEIQTEFVETSNTKYDVFIKKLVSSEYDFRQHTLIIGNSQGNVTIVIEIDKTLRNFAKFYRYVIAVPLVVLILISILVPTLTVIKRRKHNKDNQENSNPANSDVTENNRETFLRQSFDSSVGFQTGRQNLDATNTDSFDMDDSNQALAACFEVDEVSSTTTYRKEENRLNMESDLIIKSNTDDSALEEQQSIPANPEPHLENSEDRKKIKQETSNSGRAALSKKQTRCRGVGKIQSTF